jgi:hypothetical protein
MRCSKSARGFPDEVEPVQDEAQLRFGTGLRIYPAR